MLTPSAEERSFFERHRHELEDGLTAVISQVFQTRRADPLNHLAELLQRGADGSAAPEPLLLPADTEDASDKWNLVDWLAGAGLHRVVAGVIQQAVGRQGIDQHEAPLAFLRQLSDRGELAKLFHNGPMVEAMIDLVWQKVETLQSAGAATNSEIQSKFVGAIELSYSGLDTFFGGLEGVIGAPSPKLLEAMAADHTIGHGTESTDEFETSNYGIRTTSKVEWMLVVEDRASPDQLGLERWPEESPDMLPDRSKCRQRRPLGELVGAAEPRNVKLEAADQPRLVNEEIIAANLYTGPVRSAQILPTVAASSPLKPSVWPHAVTDVRQVQRRAPRATLGRALS